MEHQRFIGLQHYSAAVDHYHQSAMFNMMTTTEIKVEPDIDVYGCQVPPYIDGNLARQHPSSTSQMSQVVLGCNNPYNKDNVANIPPTFSSTVQGNEMTNLNHFCSGTRRIPNSDVTPNLTTVDGAHIPIVPQQNGIMNPSSSDTRVDGLPTHNHTCDEQVREDTEVLSNTIVSQNLPQCERMSIYSSETQKELYCVNQTSNQTCLRNESDSSDIHGKNEEINDFESDEDNGAEEPRKAYDLTCRNKSPSHDNEGSNDDQPFLNSEKIIDSSSVHSYPSSQPRSAPKPQACKVCGKVLSSASSYYVHMKLHSGNKPYACSICEAAFCRKPYLEVHMRTHTGERPFQCDMCLKRFTQKSSLNTHKRVHTGERPYSCDICHKKFAVKSYVTAHRWSHVSEKPLACQRCGLTFTSKNLFALHIRTHIDQNHECHICGRTFMKDSYLIRHQNRVHREQGAFFSESSDLRPDTSSPTTSPSAQNQCHSLATSANSSPSGSPTGSPSNGDSC